MKKKKASSKTTRRYNFDPKLLKLLGLDVNYKFTIRTILYALYDNINLLETHTEFNELRNDIKYKATQYTAIKKYIIYDHNYNYKYNRYVVLNDNKHKLIDEISIVI